MSSFDYQPCQAILVTSLAFYFQTIDVSWKLKLFTNINGSLTVFNYSVSKLTDFKQNLLFFTGKFSVNFVKVETSEWRKVGRCWATIHSTSLKYEVQSYCLNYLTLNDHSQKIEL